MAVNCITWPAGQRYDVLPCQRVEDNGGKLNLEPVWIRATMIDSDFAYPSNYNTSLGVMYFTDQQPTQLPTTTAGVLLHVKWQSGSRPITD